MNAIDLMHAIRDANTEAKIAGVRVKAFKVTRDELIALTVFLKDFLSVKSFAEWKQSPRFDGVPLWRRDWPK